MGAFSSNDRMDFRAVLSAFTDAEIPMPASGRWANAGMVRGGCPDLAWRLLDAQYWARPVSYTHLDVYKRQVFGGTSNALDFLPLDRSGNRRFIPVMVYPCLLYTS